MALSSLSIDLKRPMGLRLSSGSVNDHVCHHRCPVEVMTAKGVG
ncbi:uncharacterized protein METZ01_LOCUS332226, partial [marine metagenome]